MIGTLIAATSGYKTYMVVGAYLLCIAIEVGLGYDIPGFTAGDDWLGDLFTALGLGTLRAGVAKAAVGKIFGR